jgi:RimJ/RimL family protein N-acetyltransferase
MIRYKRVSLRPLTLKDARHYEAWINDEETNVWRGLYHPTTTTETKRWIKSQMTASTEQMAVAIEVERNGQPTIVGFMGLRAICPRSRRAELWIYLGDKTVWGHGYGQEALIALCQYGYTEMNLFRIWLETDPQHRAALRCYENVGFIQEGTLRKAYYRRGKFRDTCLMGLLRPDFEKKERRRA